jgi:anti-sigma-K factor RskA
MNCEELREEYGAFALGIAEDPERSEIAEHLARECPVCHQGVSEALATTGVIAAAVKIQNPPKDLRRRVVAMVDRKKPQTWAWSLLPWGIVAALSIVILAIALPAQRQNKDLAKLEDVLNIVSDPATHDVSFGEKAKGRVFVNGGKGVVFIGANLPKIDAGKTFELWVIPATGKPIPAGTFDAQDNANAVYVYSGSAAGAAAIAVTVEPSGGSPQPTTTPFIVTRL